MVRQVIIPASFLAPFSSPTLVRMVGSLTLVQSTNGQQFGAWGLTKTPRYLLPTTSPSPLGTGAGQIQWMHWNPFLTVFDGTPSGSYTRTMRFPIDIKQMRKFMEQDELSLCIATGAQNPTVSTIWHFQARYLIKD